jgi:hypothetical protein
MPYKELRADLPFELQDLLTQGRLGNSQMGRGISEMQVLGDGEEVAQLTKFHIFFVSKKRLQDIGLMTGLILTFAST